MNGNGFGKVMGAPDEAEVFLSLEDEKSEDVHRPLLEVRIASTPSMVLETESAHITCPLLELLAIARPVVWLARGSTTTPPTDRFEWNGAATEALPSGWAVTTARVWPSS